MSQYIRKDHNLKSFFHPQVNAQVLVSSFSPDSHQWILLGESMGRVLKACTASKEAYSQVHVTSLGRWNNSPKYVVKIVVIHSLTECVLKKYDKKSILLLGQYVHFLLPLGEVISTWCRTGYTRLTYLLRRKPSHMYISELVVYQTYFIGLLLFGIYCDLNCPYDI